MAEKKGKAAATSNKSRASVWQKQVCQFCGKEKSCKKGRDGSYTCTACASVVALTKNQPEVVEKIWRRFGPPGPALSADPIVPGKEAEAEMPAPSTTAGIVDLPPCASIEFRDLQEVSRQYGETTPFSRLLERMAAIHEAKRHDYASHEDCLGNFREAKRLGISPLQGIMVRLTDKYTRACNVIRRNGSHAVENESLEDTLIDMANYSLLAILAGREAHNGGDNDTARIRQGIIDSLYGKGSAGLPPEDQPTGGTVRENRWEFGIKASEQGA